MKRDYVEKRAYEIASEFTDEDLYNLIIELLGWYKQRMQQNIEILQRNGGKYESN